ncbi:class I SAM-dependent methyltransferase [Deinococcus sonorensis]|uniref:Methyltransferase domain-containing protein n=2 Tax=Deinococcus sonorensis TaxID=309891 RepID=A0AAU7U5I4_9DEIO
MSSPIFAGSIPQIYGQYLVPMLFAPYAADLAARVADRHPERVLELAAGTGALTRSLAERLSPSASLVATDISPPMLDLGRQQGTARPVEWRPADAMALPFPDSTFDVVVCQFGVMFFPDRAGAFAEVRRVLKPGGQLIFNVWDRMDQNDFAATVDLAVRACFPDDPPTFVERLPHGYHDLSVIRQDLAQGGFTQSAEVTTVQFRSSAASAEVVAVGFCHGTPLRTEIERRDPAGLARVTEAARRAVEDRFGSSAVEGTMQAHIVTVEREGTA